MSMIDEFNKLFKNSEADPMVFGLMLGSFALGWKAAEDNQAAQMTDFVDRTLDDLKSEKAGRLNDTEGWVDLLKAKDADRLELLKRIADVNPAVKHDDGALLSCAFCGEQIEEGEHLHAPDCLWTEATNAIAGERGGSEGPTIVHYSESCTYYKPSDCIAALVNCPACLRELDRR